MTVPEKPISLMLVCGEPSGDQLGGQLMAGLRALAGDSIVISGVGGRAMEAQGLKSLFPLDDTAVMGLREVVPKIPRILARVRDARDYALATRPDAVVLDLHLKGGNGIDVLRAIHAEAPQIVFIVLTNHPTPQHRRLCLDAGARHFLDKSNEFTRVNEIVGALPGALH
jgi:lipid A disaccharide synthetase